MNKKLMLVLFFIGILLFNLKIAQGTCNQTTKSIDIIFSLDSSGSMSFNDPAGDRKTASKNFVDKLNSSKDMAGVVSWDSAIIFTQNLTNNFTLVKAKIDQVGAFDGTNLDVGLSGALDEQQAHGRANSSRVIIFLTDGDGTYTPSGSPGSQADRAASLGIRIYTIGLAIPSGSVAESKLIEIATVSGGAYYSSPSSSNLDAIFNNISESIFCPRNPVLLVHGYCSSIKDTWGVNNNAGWDKLNFEQVLRNKGFDVYTIEFVPKPVNEVILKYVPELMQKIDDIKRQTGAKKVDVVAHSMGGLITRWYIQKMGKSYKNDIDQLVMIATPNHGSALSDLEGLNPDGFGSYKCAGSGGKVFGKNAATDMHPESTFMSELNYNQKKFDISTWLVSPDIIGDKFGVKYSTLGGTARGTLQYERIRVISSGRDLGVKTVSFLDYFGDTVVALNSLKLTNVGCNQYPGLDHTAVHENLTLLNRVVDLLKDRNLNQGDNCFPIDKSPHISLSPVISDTIIQGQEKIYDVFIDSGAINLTFGLIWDNSTNNLGFNLVDPNGSHIIPTTLGVKYNDFGGAKTYVIEYPISGIWKMNITGSNILTPTTTESFSARSSFVTDISFDVQELGNNYTKNPGDIINLIAFLFNDTNFTNPILNADIKAEIFRPDNSSENITLYDDGLHNDFNSSDGVYGNTYSNTNVAGIYNVQAIANATIDSNKSILRYSTQLFWVETYPDLKLNQSSLNITPTNFPNENQKINISVTVFNIGDNKATNVTLFLFDEINGSTVDINSSGILIPQINAGSLANIVFEWNGTTPIGNHTIIASVATFDSLEKDYDNNDANKTIVVNSGNLISSCQIINQPGNYLLSSNITLTTQYGTTCIEIQANNVIFDCNGNSIRGSGAAWSGTNAFYVAGNNSVVKNCILSDMGRGVATGGTNNLVLANIIYNMWEGINAGGNYNTYENNTVFNNSVAEGRAFTIWWGPSGHIVRGNIFTKSNYGIDLGSCSGGPPFPCITNNTFYNNYIADNIINARDFSGYNFWNISKTQGTNIIDGQFIGGNFWSDYIGSDINGDRLGDTNLPYNSSSNIINGGDYLPLVFPNISCGSIISTSTTLASDVGPCSVNGLTINTSGVTLDCAGHQIVGQLGFQTGINLQSVSGVTVKNCRIYNFSSQTLLLSSSSNNVIQDTILSSYYGDPVMVLSSNNNLFTGVIFHQGFAFRIQRSNNNLFSNGEVSSLAYPVLLAEDIPSSNNNTFLNMTFRNNGQPLEISFDSNKIIRSRVINSPGIHLGHLIGANSATNALVQENLITNDFGGGDGGQTEAIRIRGGSNNNITGNQIINNTVNGTGFVSTSGNFIYNNNISSNKGGISIINSNSNIIYNNYFNNPINAWDNGINSWNTSKTLGTNIIGGPFIGGNFWSNYIGVDNNGDGIGDQNIPYNSSSNILNGGDYLPLSSTSVSDTIAPTVSITSPISGSTVQGVITIQATATDNVAVAGVQFKVDGSNIGTEDTTSPYQVSLNTSTLTNGNHVLTATARDTSNNNATSTPVTINVSNTIPDTTPPTQPTGLSATAVSSSQINLAWTASTDNVAVAGYRIYRGGVVIVTTTSTSYSNTGLSPSTTYTYQVQAYDTSNNNSTLSASASATTQSISIPQSNTPGSPGGSPFVKKKVSEIYYNY